VDAIGIRVHDDIDEQSRRVEAASTRLALQPGKASIAEESAGSRRHARCRDEDPDTSGSDGLEDVTRSLFAHEAYFQELERHSLPATRAQLDARAAVGILCWHNHLQLWYSPELQENPKADHGRARCRIACLAILYLQIWLYLLLR
jgi:hypothetical protein